MQRNAAYRAILNSPSGPDRKCGKKHKSDWDINSPASYRHLCIFLAFDFVYYLCPCSQTFLITELYLIVQRVLLLI